MIDVIREEFGLAVLLSIVQTIQQDANRKHLCTKPTVLNYVLYLAVPIKETKAKTKQRALERWRILIDYITFHGFIFYHSQSRV